MVSGPDDDAHDALTASEDPADAEAELLGERIGALRGRHDDAEARLLRAAVVKRVAGKDTGPITVGRFRITRVLGRGGFATVYEAHDPKLGRDVALKVFSALGTDDQRLVEARALARLSHPNVVVVFDADRVDDDVCIAMELVRGRNLRELVRARKPSVGATLDLMIAAGRGLAAAHAAGLVHRDLKPENILVGDDGRVRLGDFGLAAFEDTAAVAPEAGPPRRPSALELLDGLASRRTRRHGGTPAYMSPEQLRGDPIDARSDQWSFCLTALEVLQRRRPCFTADGERIADAPAWGSPPKPLPGAVRAVLLRGLSAAPADRFGDMAELLDALARAHPVRRRRQRAVAAIAAAGVLVALGASWFGVAQAREEPCDDGGAEIARAWNPPMVIALTGHFTALGAGASAPRVTGQLDAYAAAWRDMYRSACRATRVYESESEDVFDQRMACLESDRRELATVASFLVSEVDRAGALRAVDAAARLTPIDGCAADRVNSSAGGATRTSTVQVLPTDPVRRALARGLEADLGEAKALYLVGKGSAAVDRDRVLVAEADALEDAPLIAIAAGDLAEAEVVAQQYQTALGDIDRAIHAAAQAHHDLLEARAWLTRIFDLSKLGRYDEALAARLPAESALDRAPAFKVVYLRGRLLSYVGTVQGELGHFDDAIASLRQALPLLEATPAAARQRDVAGAHEALAAVLVARGDKAAARVEYEAGLHDMEAALGDSHPDVATALYNLTTALSDSTDAAQIETSLSRALAIQEAVFGPTSQAAAYTLNRRGVLEHFNSRFDAAWDDLERARGMFEVAGPRRMVAMVLANEGDLRLDQHQPQDAIELLHRALPIQEAAMGAEHPDVTLTLSTLGDALTEQDPSSLEAQRVLERSVAIRTKVYGPRHRFTAANRQDLGYVLAHRGQLAAAERECGAAMAILEPQVPRNSPQLLSGLLCLGEIALQRGRGADAVALGERAQAIQDGAEPSWLVARGLWARGGDPARARQLAEKALAIYTTLGLVVQRREVARLLAAHR